MSVSRSKMPVLQIYNRQRKVGLPLAWLREVAQRALPLCVEARRVEAIDCVLPDLAEVEVSYISDRAIARVHGQFLQDAEPTDVITFHHGELLISAEMAVRQAAEQGTTAEHEMALYLVHGLLHLAGWHDHEAAEAAEMARVQEAILSQSQICSV